MEERKVMEESNDGIAAQHNRPTFTCESFTGDPCVAGERRCPQWGQNLYLESSE